jgi:hypothetical protein
MNEPLCKSRSRIDAKIIDLTLPPFRYLQMLRLKTLGSRSILFPFFLADNGMIKA